MRVEPFDLFQHLNTVHALHVIIHQNKSRLFLYMLQAVGAGSERRNVGVTEVLQELLIHTKAEQIIINDEDLQVGIHGHWDRIYISKRMAMPGIAIL